MVLSLYFIEIIYDSNQTSINPRQRYQFYFQKLKNIGLVMKNIKNQKSTMFMVLVKKILKIINFIL